MLFWWRNFWGCDDFSSSFSLQGENSKWETLFSNAFYLVQWLMHLRMLTFLRLLCFNYVWYVFLRETTHTCLNWNDKMAYLISQNRTFYATIFIQCVAGLYDFQWHASIVMHLCTVDFYYKNIYIYMIFNIPMTYFSKWYNEKIF